jgi:preprotein translocase subunit SecB
MSTNGGQQHGQPPQLNVLAQYTKNFLFKNPNAPKSMRQSGQPAINVQINVNPNQLSSTDFEVALRLDGKAEVSGTALFNFELVYAGVFRLQNFSQEQTAPVVMIECPRLLFPFARQIAADAVLKAGFPPLRLDAVDFASMYRQNLVRSQSASA